MPSALLPTTVETLNPSMETKIMKFLGRRQSRRVGDVDDEPFTQSAPYEASLPSSRQPIFLYQPLGKSPLELRREARSAFAAPVRSLSYDQTTSGKAPIFLASLPQKGNGPVKLQASRRLSSGEFVTSTENCSTTLQNIRDGDYIVGRKEQPMSRAQRSSLTPSRLQPGAHGNSPSPLPDLIYSNPPLATQPWSSTPDLVPGAYGQYDRSSHSPTNTSIGLGLSPSAYQKSRPSPESQPPRRQGLSRPAVSQSTIPSSGSQPSETSATLKALRKAEYTRLVEMYGPEVAARNLAKLDREHMALHRTSIPRPASQSSPVILQPLPAPPNEHRENDSRRTSHMSGTSESCCDEWSGTSSPQRVSFISSCAESSNATAQTSLAEDDQERNRDDIRKMIECMRSTYLSALEQRSPTPARPKSRRKRQARAKLMPSPALNRFDLDMFPGPASSERQTWHPDRPGVDNFATRRTHSHPVHPVSRLSPIQASPSRDDGTEEGLRRADSATLGDLVADLTRAKMRGQTQPSSASRTSRPSTPTSRVNTKKSSWLNLESDSAEEPHVESPSDVSTRQVEPRIGPQLSTTHVHPAVGEDQQLEDMDAIYQDLFGKDVDGIWGSLSVAETIPKREATFSHNGTTLAGPSNTLAQKTFSIPESPEYTRLARTERGENNFI